MAGIHQFTSSAWIQSGSEAKFQSGIVVSESFDVEGTIIASAFSGDGSALTGVGKVFFAGTGSALSESTPRTEDIVIQLGSGESLATVESVRIETTSSANFLPNYYTFVKITDKFTTIDSGSRSYYSASNRDPLYDATDPEYIQVPSLNDFAPGVHRYLVYGAQTGSGGDTQQVFTTITIKSFVNELPTIIIPTGSVVGSPLTMSMVHDEDSIEMIAHFTSSEDTNIDDFIRVYSASRDTSNPAVNYGTNTPSYTFTMRHHQADILNDKIWTASINTDGDEETGGTAEALLQESLVFTASVSSYDMVDNNRVLNQVINRDEEFRIGMLDNNVAQGATGQGAPNEVPFTMSVFPPPTASIDNIRVEFESGSYSGIVTSSYETTILYDDVETRQTASDLATEYTASLVRLRVTADITEPPGYTTADTHFTTVRILSASSVPTNTAETFNYFRFSGSQETASTYHTTEIGHDTPYTAVTESEGFTGFIFGDHTAFFSVASNRLHYTTYIKHGNNDHYKATHYTDHMGKLIVNPCPVIEISDIVVEVESGSYLTNELDTERTASILYGYTTTLLTAETSSLEGYEKSNEYISESVVRLRLRAKVQEPFGPHHTIITASIDAVGGDYSHTFYFETGSTSHPSGAIDFSWGRDENYRLTASYTSSWKEFKYNPGEYTFTPTFTSPTNADINDYTSYITECHISVSQTPPTQIEDIVYETETYGYSEVTTTSGSRKILYGVPHYSLADSMSFATHPSASNYASQSVSRFRVRAKITEPFGPHHTESRFEKSFETANESTLTDSITFSTASTDVPEGYSSSGYDSNNRLTASYTSSWVGQQLSSSGYTDGTTWSYLSGSILHTPADLSGFTTTSGQTSSLIVYDTEQTKIRNLKIETETFGESGIGQNYPSFTPAQRTILYGKTTSESTGSDWPNNPEYTASSVTRFRILVDVEEPFGFHHHSTAIKYNKDNQHTGDTGTGDGTTKTFNTSSAYNINWGYDNNNRLTASYTSSWINEALAPSYNSIDQDTWEFHFTDNDTYILHNPSDENGRTILDDISQATNYTAVSASPDVKVENYSVEVEQFPYSSSIGTDSRTETILYGQTATLQDTIADTIGDLWSGSACVRFRVLVDITEPKGPQHTPMDFTLNKDNSVLKTFIFKSGSDTGDIETSSSGYNTNNDYTASYTSSWYGNTPVTPFTVGTYNMNSTASHTSQPVGEFYTDGLLDDKADTVASLTINNHDDTQIKNIRVEAETPISGSGVGTPSRVTTLLHGKNVTETVKATNSGYNIPSQEQLVSVRVLADIIEPFGPHHTSSVFTIGGYSGGNHKVTVHTGSTEISNSIKFDYNVHSSQSVFYTSSFVPIELNSTATVTYNSVLHNTDSGLVTVTHLGGTEITVNPPPSASVYTVPETSSDDTDWSSSVDLAKYVTYEGADISVDIVSGISAIAPPTTSLSTLTFPANLEVNYDATDTVDIVFNPTTGDANNSADTSSLEIDTALLNDLTDVGSYTIYVTGSDTEPGNGTSSNNPFTFNIVPAKPRTLHGEYWSNSGGSSHIIVSTYAAAGINIPPIGGSARLYKASLPTGLDYYKGDEPAGNTVTNVMMAKDTSAGPTNYTMSFTTPSNFNGNYTNTDRAYDFGDTGSLIVKVNGVEKVNASLQAEFVEADKTGNQSLEGYDENGWSDGTASWDSGKSRLILTKVAPFNNVSQSIYRGDRYYPNGYQGWAARLELDNKQRDGYNILEFSHSIDGTTTQSLEPFEWYYDDGITTASIDTSGIISWSFDPVGSITQSYLSGVSFFRKQTTQANNHLVLSLKDRLLGLANKTYRDPSTSTQAAVVITTTGVEFTEDTANEIEIDSGSTLNNNTTLYHDLTSTSTRDGLVFSDTAYDSIIPTTGSSGSIDKITAWVNTTLPSNPADKKGIVYTLDIKPQIRTYNGNNSWTHNPISASIPVGRWLNDFTPITSNTDESEFFGKEDYRWTSQSAIDLVELNDPGNLFPASGNPVQDGALNWWTGSERTDYTSSNNISQSTDLQVRYDGALVYPTIDYTRYDGITNRVTNPTFTDYSNASGSGDRYYYRIISVPDPSGQSSYKMKIGTSAGEDGILKSDIWAGGPPAVGIDTLPVRIDMRLVGTPTTAGTGNTGVPGTKWGVVTGGETAGTNPAADDWGTATAFLDKEVTAPEGSGVTTEHHINFTLRTMVADYNGGIFLVRVRFKDNATGSRMHMNSLTIVEN